MSDKKSIFNMPGDELEAMIKRLSRYTLAVELVALAACAPMLTQKVFLMLTIATILMCFDCFFMNLCSERKNGIWKVIFRTQFLIAVTNSVCIAIFIATKANIIVTVMTVITYIFLWIHNIMCFVETRKDESISFMRHVGAFIILVTIIICLIARKVLLDLGISF